MKILIYHVGVIIAMLILTKTIMAQSSSTPVMIVENTFLDLAGRQPWLLITKNTNQVHIHHIDHMVVVMARLCPVGNDQGKTMPEQPFCEQGIVLAVDRQNPSQFGVILGRLNTAYLPWPKVEMTKIIYHPAGNLSQSWLQDLPSTRGCKAPQHGVLVEMMASRLLQDLFGIVVRYGC